MAERAVSLYPVSKLIPHPGNPRKDLGDLTELTASIRAAGILQNLTVVPAFQVKGTWPELKSDNINGDAFVVVIGHRRLAAAKLAGLRRVPCVVADMTPEEQIATMLAENIQRSALTPYEEAKGFEQLSIDFGKSVTEIAEMSGFSESTVRSRLKLAKLDKKKVDKGFQNGATIADFLELDRVKDPEARKKCLDVIGTNNFRNALRSALDRQEREALLQRCLDRLSEFAESVVIAESHYVDGKRVVKTADGTRLTWVQYISSNPYSNPEETIDKMREETIRYYYTQDGSYIAIYRDYQEEDETETPEEKAKREEKERWDARVKEATEIRQRHYTLRRDFVLGYGAAKTNISRIVCAAPEILSRSMGAGVCNPFSSNKRLEQILPKESPENNLTVTIRRNVSKSPEKTFLLTLFALADDETNGYFDRDWIYGEGIVPHAEAIYKENTALDQLYYLLKELGYEISDEEQQMRHGTHPLLSQPKPDETDETS